MNEHDKKIEAILNSINEQYIILEKTESELEANKIKRDTIFSE